MLVGRMAALMGSPSQRSMTWLDGRSAPISRATQEKRKTCQLLLGKKPFLVLLCKICLLLRSKGHWGTENSKIAQQPNLYETPNSYSQEVREGIPILGPLWTYRPQSSCYSHIRSGSCATCPEQIQKNIVKYIWPNNHHSLKKPPYRFHPVLPPLTLPLALVQQQKETYHIHVFSSPLYSSVCVVGAFSIISSLRSSGATKGTRIQNCTWTSTLFRTQWIQKASFN